MLLSGYSDSRNEDAGRALNTRFLQECFHSRCLKMQNRRLKISHLVVDHSESLVTKEKNPDFLSQGWKLTGERLSLSS